MIEVVLAEYGLIVRNINSEIQIDSLWTNFTFHDAGVTSVSGEYAEVDFADTANVPVIGIRPSHGMFCVLNSLKKSGDNYIKAYVGCEKGKSGSIGWIVFTDNEPAPLPEYGLVIKNQNDKVVFSSGEKYFKIINIYPVTVEKGGYVDVTVDDADNNYFILYPYSLYGNRVFQGTFYLQEFCMGLKKISTETLRVGTFLWCSTAFPSGYEPTPYSFWIKNCFLVEVNT